MGRYVLRRLLLIIPTLFGIILINFTIVQFAPGGPIEQIIAKATMGQMSTTAGISGGGDAGMSSQQMEISGQNQATYGLDPKLIEDLEKQFGFDKPVHERFFTMVVNYLQFDFGNSYFQDLSLIHI